MRRGGNFLDDIGQTFKTVFKEGSNVLHKLGNVPLIGAPLDAVANAYGAVAGAGMDFEGGYGTPAGAAKNSWLQHTRQWAADNNVPYHLAVKHPQNRVEYYARQGHQTLPPRKPKRPKGIRKYGAQWQAMTAAQKRAQRELWAQVQPIRRKKAGAPKTRRLPSQAAVKPEFVYGANPGYERKRVKAEQPVELDEKQFPAILPPLELPHFQESIGSDRLNGAPDNEIDLPQAPPGAPPARGRKRKAGNDDILFGIQEEAPGAPSSKRGRTGQDEDLVLRFFKTLTPVQLEAVHKPLRKLGPKSITNAYNLMAAALRDANWSGQKPSDQQIQYLFGNVFGKAKRSNLSLDGSALSYQQYMGF